MNVATSLSEIASMAPWAFLAGVVIGFVLANRYRLTRRDKNAP